MKVYEVFSSIQGEGKYTGYPTTFIRLFGCHFNCKYCDEPNAKLRFHTMTIAQILSVVNRLGNKHVCITGGEPLEQSLTLSLVYELQSYSYIVSIETSGLVPIEDCEYHRTYSYCMDIKCPCSGMQDKNVYKNLKLLKDYDEVKFVVRNDKDIEFVKSILKKYPTKASVILSPINNGKKTCELIINALTNGKIRGKIGIQLHKVIHVR